MNRSLVVIVWMVMMEMGCSTIEDCQLSPYQDSIVVAFRTTGTVDFDSILVQGYGRMSNDSIIGNLYSLPLGLDEDEVTYGFYTDSTDYFLSLRYSTQILIYDVHCDPQVQYILSEYATNADSVVLNSAIIRNEFPIHLEIYF